jgi:diguanylate cyclase (GGDEF)-like protein/PAS domain S-box-containing protein
MSIEHEINVETLQAEIMRLNKIIQSLMNRAEHNTSILGSNFNLFQTAITLEDKVRRRTEELENAREKMEKLTRTLREKEYQTRLLVENSPVSIHEIDLDGKVTFMNRAGLRMRGLNDEDEVKGTMYIDAVSTKDQQRVSQLLALAYTGETSHFEFEGSGPNKKMYASSFIPILKKNGQLEKLMGITEDVTERKNAEEQLRNFAFYDLLTHLPNRRLFNDRLEQAMSAGKRSGYYSALLFLDLDNFKALNDTRGHDTGDLLLIEVARRISACLREIDTVARLGGDEFVVLISNLDVDKKAAYDKAYIAAEKIRSVLAEPYLLICKQADNPESIVEHNSTASIGVVLFINNNAGKEEIIKLADAAMYAAKAGGRNQVSFSQIDMESQGEKLNNMRKNK